MLLNKIIEHQLGEKQTQSWELDSWKTSFKRICASFEGLADLVDHEIDTSNLVEIAELIKEFDEE